MIIESIELTNFMCYSGTNRFDFSEGMNVIIGDNAYGKSKLYDGFYWAMYDQCFVPNEKVWKKTRFLGSSIISDKTVHETTEGIVRTSVRLTFRDIGRDCQYIIKRILTGEKKDGEFTADNDSVEEVTFRKIAGMTGKLITGPEEIEQIKKRVLPDNIRPYMWFQGEQVESIIDFGERDSLTRAINVLSNISRFDDIAAVADAWEKSTSDQYHRKVRSLSSDKSTSDALELKRKAIEEKISELKKDEIKYRDNVGNAEEDADKLINKQAEANRIKELDMERKSLERQLNTTIENEERERVDLHQKLFSRRWVLKGTEGLVQTYNDKFMGYQDAKMMKKARAEAKVEAEEKLLKDLQSRLPINVPEPIYLEKMLAEEKCMVCNRDAPKNKDAWNYMNESLKRFRAKPKENEEEKFRAKHDFSSEFRRLSQHGYAMEQDIHRIDGDIKSTFKRLTELDRQRRKLTEDFEKVTKEYDNLVTESAIDSEQASNLLNELQLKNDFASRFRTELTRTQIELERKYDELEDIDKKLESLVTEELPVWMEEKKKMLTDFKELAHSTRKRVFDSLVDQLESEANKHYRQMMQGNLSAHGIIKLVESSKGNYMPRLVDDQDRPLLQLNTGNIILIKLATIMAIISARQGSRDTDLYTLITDAPMSVFGEDYTMGFCKTVSSVYRQSIIMSKEFYRNENLRRQLLNDKDINLGKVYIITPSILEKERVNRNTLTTNIKALN